MAVKPARDQRTPRQSHSSGSYRETGMGGAERFHRDGGELFVSRQENRNYNKNVFKKEKKIRKIQETKCTCSACGNIWFYGKADVTKEINKSDFNTIKTLACCSGCWLPALVIPHREPIDFSKCPKCNSKAITKEAVVHDV